MPDGKNFAGSIATTSRLVRTMVQRAGVELTAAVRMAALTPARMLGMDAEIGSTPSASGRICCCWIAACRCKA